jgi:hypothetical protein
LVFEVAAFAGAACAAAGAGCDWDDCACAAAALIANAITLAATIHRATLARRCRSYWNVMAFSPLG